MEYIINPTYKTFNEWRQLGFIVVKGEKSFTKNEKGICTFSSEQVVQELGIKIDYELYPDQSDLY